MDNAAGTIMPLMMQTDRCHRMIIEGQVHRLGVHRTQHMILMCLSHCETPPAQSEIAEMFQVSHAAVAVSLRKMEQAGLIDRVRQGQGLPSKIYIHKIEIPESEEVLPDVFEERETRESRRYI